MSSTRTCLQTLSWKLFDVSLLGYYSSHRISSSVLFKPDIPFIFFLISSSAPTHTTNINIFASNFPVSFSSLRLMPTSPFRLSRVPSLCTIINLPSLLRLTSEGLTATPNDVTVNQNCSCRISDSSPLPPSFLSLFRSSSLIIFNNICVFCCCYS